MYLLVLFATVAVACALSSAMWVASGAQSHLVAACGWAVSLARIMALFFISAVTDIGGASPACGAMAAFAIALRAVDVMAVSSFSIWVHVRGGGGVRGAMCWAPPLVYASLSVAILSLDCGVSGWAALQIARIALLAVALYRLGRDGATKEGPGRYARCTRRFSALCGALVACMACESLWVAEGLPHIASASFDLAALIAFNLGPADGIFVMACTVAMTVRSRDALTAGWAGVSSAGRGGHFKHAPEAGMAEVLDSSVYQEQNDREDDSSSQRAEQIVAAMRAFAIDRGLTARERDVLRLLMEDKDTQNIASALVISPGTVKSHLHRIYRKAGVTGRDDLIREVWNYAAKQDDDAGA